MVALSVPTRRKKVQGEKYGELNLSLEITLSDSDECPPSKAIYNLLPTRNQEHWFFFSPLLESTGWIARVQGRVFIKINWATQLFTVFSKCCSICPSPGLDMLFLLFSQYLATPQCTRVHLFVIYGLIFLSSRKGGDLFLVQSRGRGFQEGRQQALDFLLPALPACQSLPSPFPPSFSSIRNCYQLHMDRFMHGWGPASLPLIV